MGERTVERRRLKISVTVDPDLLKAVDRFVANHRDLDRSKVVDDALFLWYARQQERAMEEELTAPQSLTEQEERATWRRIQRAAAERIFQEPRTSNGGA